MLYTRLINNFMEPDRLGTPHFEDCWGDFGKFVVEEVVGYRAWFQISNAIVLQVNRQSYGNITTVLLFNIDSVMDLY